MARRSDHSPTELRDLLVAAGHAQMAERGFARFSAREAARRAGYTVGTIYHVFGSLDAYVLAINTRTFREWTLWLDQALSACDEEADRIAALVRGYFEFAGANRNCWMAIYDHRRPDSLELNPSEVAERAKLTAIVDREVARALGCAIDDKTRRLARSLIAIVHGHCSLHLGGSFALMGESNPAAQAIARVRESLAYWKAPSAAPVA